jgi:glutathione synthase/RimK-type ligase-like ATP-grasp enzyme
MILLVGHTDDPHVQAVVRQLEEAQRDHFLLDVNTLRSDFICMKLTATDFSCVLSKEGRSVDIKKITAVWLRRVWSETVSDLQSQMENAFVQGELRHVLRALWSFLQDCYWMNSLEAVHNADQKPYQLYIAKQTGLNVPTTLISAETDLALKFCHDHNGDILYKPFNCYSETWDEKVYLIYANRLNCKQLSENKEGITQAPCLFQEYIPKQLELRVVVIGEHVLAFSIDSQASSYSSVDWRRYDFDNVSFASYELPGQITALLLSFMRTMKLVFGCIDMILTPSGRYVFLEVNSAGNWLWLEAITKTPISKYISDSLFHRGRIGTSHSGVRPQL